MFKKIVQIDLTNVERYCMNQELLNGCEVIIVKIDFTLDKNLKNYLLLSKIAKQKEILPLFVLLNSTKDSKEKLKVLKNESYFEVDSDATFQTLYEEIAGAVTARGEDDISLNTADLKTVFVHKGLAFFGSAQECGSDASLVALVKAIKSAKIKNNSLNNMQGVLVYFSIHPDYEVMKLAEAMEMFYEHTHYDAEIIWGTTTDNTLTKEYVKVVVLLTGCESCEFKQMAANNLQYKS